MDIGWGIIAVSPALIVLGMILSPCIRFKAYKAWFHALFPLDEWGPAKEKVEDQSPTAPNYANPGSLLPVQPPPSYHDNTGADLQQVRTQGPPPIGVTILATETTKF